MKNTYICNILHAIPADPLTLPSKIKSFQCVNQGGLQVDHVASPPQLHLPRDNKMFLLPQTAGVNSPFQSVSVETRLQVQAHAMCTNHA